MEQAIMQNFNWPDVAAVPTTRAFDAERRWFAVFTLSQNEQSARRHMDACGIESFVPTYETLNVWKNRQRVKVVKPLFPTYMFVRVHSAERSVVLRTPGVRRIVGNHEGPVALPDSEIEFLRSKLCRQQVQPCDDFELGEKVRIKNGPMQGFEGLLVRKKNSLRFVLTLELINQSASVEVGAEEIESLTA